MQCVCQPAKRLVPFSPPSHLNPCILFAKKIVVTGGGGTLALTTARALLEHGASGLLLCDISFSPQAVQEIRSLTDDFPSAKVLRIVVDVTDEASLHRAVEHGTTTLGTIDILICFAGIVACTPAIDTTPEEWRRTLDINTTGAFLSAQAVARPLIATKTPGSIIFIASISAHKTNFPQPQAAYNASKAALLSLKGSLAAEWAVHGIRVNSVSPGYMDTVLNEGEGLAEARKVWMERNPMGRMGQPEVTGAVLLLCSSAGSYMTGMDLRVDGGQCCI